ncbi:MAG: hypothetical protein V1934_02080 [Methanobacteriota archaeon]
MKQMDKYRMIAGALLFGSIWGMLECVLGSMKMPSGFESFPLGAVLGGLFGFGIMAYTRRIYGVMWMQLGMGVVAGFLRFWAPIGTCVVCSALAIVAESLVFELIFNRPALSIRGFAAEGAEGKSRAAAITLVPLGFIAAYAIYVTGYVFTQVMTPVITGSGFVMSDFASVLPLIIGRGLFAALCGAVALPFAVLVRQLDIEVTKVAVAKYYAGALVGSVMCWGIVLALFLPRLLGQ